MMEFPIPIFKEEQLMVCTIEHTMATAEEVQQGTFRKVKLVITKVLEGVAFRLTRVYAIWGELTLV
jgi:hypothetical protein